MQLFPLATAVHASKAMVLPPRCIGAGFMKTAGLQPGFSLRTPFIRTGIRLGNVGARTAKDVTNQPGSQQLPFAEGKVLVVSANTVIYVRLPADHSPAEPPMLDR